jgi:hypothetical protein
VTDALFLIEVHSINGTDAIILRLALNLAARLHGAGQDLVLVASDQRLLRAAQAEGLLTFNPETQNQVDLDALLNDPAQISCKESVLVRLYRDQ